ncbi:MAG: ubiquinone biosynthesis protein UbiE [Rhodopirellula sp.]|nr:ubiquinone biosynthesis protein UbiE [Rhodopirellula sp.]MBL98492.1 ubiquinone biosynthesis protein UbiE [Rhodopirellula sp.]HCA50635.1 ubiquinone biosynthesis protein UbiE [Planctomycetaceae bacterium]|tara:strand:- start:13840 stop:14502 length:663 start_codon:yes stop_codon:yes gene_type:complete
MALERVLEPEVMDTYEEARDYDSMDHQAVNKLFVDDLLAVGNIGNDILDVGTGTAQIPVELCRQSEDCRIIAIDMAVHMLDLARFNIEVDGFTQRIFLQQIDAKDMLFESEMFDCVMSNSIIHHIPEPLAVLAESIRVTRPGGLLFFRDLLRPESGEEVAHLVSTYAGDENEHQRQMFDDSLRAALSLSEVRAMVSSLGFEAETVQATSDRHWTWIAIKP